MCLASHRFGYVPVLCQVLQVFGPNPGQDVHGRGYWRAGISGQVMNDWIGPGPVSIKSNQP